MRHTDSIDQDSIRVNAVMDVIRKQLRTAVRLGPMQKWEYATFNSQRTQKNDEVVQSLNRFGMEGWELVSCTPVFETSLFRYVFKRPLA